uniref:Uncharacterized protein n=1 Tax=Cacopsylla melanoneura TaxID=428564 RepID=A0A8D8LGY6_9HEMI
MFLSPVVTASTSSIALVVSCIILYYYPFRRNIISIWKIVNLIFSSDSHVSLTDGEIRYTSFHTIAAQGHSKCSSCVYFLLFLFAFIPNVYRMDQGLGPINSKTSNFALLQC